MKVIVWNLEHKLANWGVLADSNELADADIALLCEAPEPPDGGANALGHWSTKGLDCRCPGPGCEKKRWSTAVMSPHSMDPIEDARKDRYYGKPLPFGPSRAGTWIAARVHVDGVAVTAISLYGLMDERSDASVHRSLSELSPILDHKEYGKYVLLGGDLNILAGRPRRADPDRHQVVLARLKAYGLVDCLAEMRPSGPLKGCQCRLGDNCTHTWTYRSRHLKRSHIPYQDDYLFASRALAPPRLTSCYAMGFNEDSPSDHAPIIASFQVRGLRS
jgi:hypothetical protein